MKNHFRLNFNFQPLNPQFVFPKVRDFSKSPADNWQLSIHKAEEMLSTECLDFFRSLDLEPWNPHLFCGGPSYSSTIHIDGEGLGSGPLWAINWIYGSNNSVMTWYKPIQPGSAKKTPSNTTQIIFTEDQVEAIDILEFDQNNCGPILVRTDIPHKVVNHDLNNPRYCLSVRFKQTKINNWFSAIKYFRPYLIL
jgi:hypothetical protein